MHPKTVRKVESVSMLTLCAAVFSTVLLIVKQSFYFLLISMLFLIISIGSEAFLFYYVRMPSASIKEGIRSIILLILFIYLLFFH